MFASSSHEPMEEGQPEDAAGSEAMDLADPAEPSEPLPDVSLEIFNVIKSKQAEHGLRHGDHARYRAFCSRRLHRIRKGLGFLHGKGRFVKRALEPSMVREPRHLLIPLYTAERAYAYAMVLKRKNQADNPRLKFRLLHRLNKAAKWSAELARLSSERGDKRTALEAEAYAGFMSGNVHLERERWALALAQLRRTKTICTELCRVSMADQVRQYNQVVEEIMPSIRFCTYNLRASGEGGEEDGAEMDDEGGGGVEGLLDDGAVAEGAAGSDILRSKLEAILHESRARQAEALNEIEVLGERVPIKSEKVRMAILASQQKILEIEHAGAAAEGQMERYDELFVAFNDALEGVRADLRQAAKDGSARAGYGESSLRKLQASLTWQKHDHTVRRTLLLVEDFKRSLRGVGGAGGGAAGGGGAGGKRVAPEDIVRLYDSAIATLGEMGSLDAYREDEGLMGQLAARTAAAKACRSFYLAETYSAAAHFAEAQALYSRAEALMGEARPLLEEAGCANPVPPKPPPPSPACPRPPPRAPVRRRPLSRALPSGRP